MKIDLTWELASTPHPDEFAFITRHDQDDLAKIGTTGDNGWPIEGTTLYKNWFRQERGRVHQSDDTLLYGNYVNFDSKAEGGVVTFVWTKEKTTVVQNTPFRDTPESRPYPWHAVLKFIKPIPDYTAQRSGIRISGGSQGHFAGPEYYAQLGIIPQGSYGTKVTRFEYFGPRKFQMGPFPTPIGTAISLMLPGRETIHIADCLHQKIKIPELVTSTEQILGGAGSGSYSSIQAQVFPSTEPFETWQSHTILFKQERMATGYYAIRDVVTPPGEPEVIIRFQQ